MSATPSSPADGAGRDAATTTGAGRATDRKGQELPPQPRMAFGRWFAELGIRHVIGIVFVIYAAFPIVYVISASLAGQGATLTGSNSLFTSFDVGSYSQLSDTTLYWTWFRNTMFIGLSTAIGTVVMAAAAAYAFSRFRFKGHAFGLNTLLVLQMFPQLLAFVAIFLLLLSIGEVVPSLGLNSRIGLICVYLGGALGTNTFLMYGFFNTVPKELDEAAKIDGASHARIYWTIILRMVAPVLAVVGLLSFVSTFSDFVIARVVLQSEQNWTLALGLYQMVSSLTNQNWGMFAAGAVIAAVPVLLLFLFLQRYIVGGLTAGSVKG
ncbi:sugar ABC transporter permease [Georgenia sp. Z1344]|uniref:sugar ABC transporter permease n=1 Tax=Georgenia sp. Z1344 TaxID=3416706 RepID=UPI003CF79EAE